MATVVCFHAHPDDEAISTGGFMAAAAAAGHRVVLVTATKGECGVPQPGVLAPGQELWERRVLETARSATILGCARQEFLGFRDSGMMGETTNADLACFWQAKVDIAAARLAAILDEEKATLLTIYDPSGTYGHPDHIQVHRVGKRAAEMVAMGPERIFEATINRDSVREMQREIQSSDAGDTGPDIDIETFGVAADGITHAIDVSAFVSAKRAAMAAHESQIGPDDFFLAMPPDRFAAAFGTEWFVCHGGRPDGTSGPPFASDLLAGLR